MSSRTTKDCAWLALAVAVSRYLFRTESPYLLDSINFILGVNEFDPTRHQPHPPGYYLYIQGARLLQFVWSDPHTALVALSILASCGAVVLVYLLSLQWFGRRAALFSGLLFVASPLCWFHGGVALVYIVEMFFSALVGLLCWRNAESRGKSAFSSAVALGLAAGVRQSSIVFLGPLWLFSLRRAGAARIAAACALLAATLLAWMLPMAAASGGGEQYWDALADLWNRAAGQGLTAGSIASKMWPVVSRALCVAVVYVLIFATAAPLPLMRPMPGGFDSPKRLFAAVWIAPGLLFFVLIFMRLINGGYLLVLIPPVMAFLGAQAAEWFEESQSAGRGRLAVVGVFVALNIAAFLFTPTYFSYSHVRTDARETIGIERALRGAAPPENTLIVGFDDHMHGARHAGYYFPEYLSIECPGSATERGVRIVAMRQGNTEILQSLPAGPYQRFVLFPPRPSPADSPNLSTAREAFPPGALRVEKVGGYEVVTGSVRDLHYLFPEAARMPE